MTAQEVNWFQRDPGGTTTYSTPPIKTSTRCTNGDCVEIAPLRGAGSAVRATGNSNLTLTFTIGEWTEFMVAVKVGEFDNPV